jgi:hypothetical protein
MSTIRAGRGEFRLRRRCRAKQADLVVTKTARRSAACREGDRNPHDEVLAEHTERREQAAERQRRGLQFEGGEGEGADRKRDQAVAAHMRGGEPLAMPQGLPEDGSQKMPCQK